VEFMALLEAALVDHGVYALQTVRHGILITVIKTAIVYLSLMEVGMLSAELGTQLESYVAKLVESGRYNSKSEVVREGIRLLQERETRLAVLDQALSRGLADAQAGQSLPVTKVFKRLEAKYKAMDPGAE
jgi:antitoxin ParD1/3/4